ncbi:Type I phosphodiesterase / nucleotide pyrophosphatase [Variovorax sp. OK605]|nr:MFS transporter [Variovorax sp. OK605]SFP86630.1 Type I phosphodiesterase / nucleotide pyrophosphatase [Variovorax sp. OK605]
MQMANQPLAAGTYVQPIDNAFRRTQWRMLLAAMFCYFFFYTGRQTFGFAIPGIQKEFGLSKEMLGWASSCLLWCYAIGQAINGNLADKLGGRRVITAGAILSCAANWVVSFAVGFKSLAIPWGVNGYFQALGWAPGSRLLSNWWGMHERGKVFGCYTFAAGCASVLSFVTSILVVNVFHLEWRWIFRLPVLLMLVGGITFYLIARERPEDMGFKSPDTGVANPEDAKVAAGDQAATESSWTRYKAVLSNPRLIIAALAIIPNPVPGNKHVLLIGIDGLRGDAIQCQGCAQTPAMSALIAGGAFHGNVLAGGPLQDTVSGPGWSTVFTGFWADKHGVTSNNTSLSLNKPHVFDLIKQAWPTATTAVVADWENLTTNLRPKNANFVVRNGAKNSQQATNTVKEWLSWTNAPTAIFYYLHNVDSHAASYAPLNAFYQSKIVGEDQQIQQVLNALVARPNYANEEWLIVVTSDHGGLNSGHGGQSAGERDTLLIMNNNYRNPLKTSYCRGNLSGTTMLQADGATPHILDFLGRPNNTEGHKNPSCRN